MTDPVEPDWTDTDTTDLRAGPPLAESLLAVLPLVGRWRGSGHGSSPVHGGEFSYRQQIMFSHDGRPFLAYESHTWVLTDNEPDTEPAWRSAARETGYWRVGPGEDDVELVLALQTGIAEVLTGLAGDARWELETKVLVKAPTAVDVRSERRFYAVVGDTLLYAQEVALGGADFRPHLNARLERVRG